MTALRLSLPASRSDCASLITWSRVGLPRYWPPQPPPPPPPAIKTLLHPLPVLARVLERVLAVLTAAAVTLAVAAAPWAAPRVRLYGAAHGRRPAATACHG